MLASPTRPKEAGAMTTDAVRTAERASRCDVIGGFVGMPSGRSLCSILVVLLWAAASLPANAQPSAPQSVADPKGRFTIDFPADWRVLTPQSGIVAVMGIAPPQGQTHRASVNVIVEDLARDMPAQAYAEISERMLKTIFQDYTVVQQGPVAIAGQAAYYRYYTWRTNTGDVFYQVQVYVTAGRRGFVITGSTLNEPESMRRDVPIIVQIIGTFRPITKT
jgi:hypothetical protein